MPKIAAILLLFFSTLDNYAQMVQSTAYNLMLKTMLSHNVRQIDAESAKKSNALFLDARTKKEFDVSHIKDAVWVGYDDFDLGKVRGLTKNQPIIVYCSIGYRSEKVTERIQSAGFTNVSNLYGGIFEWKNIGEAVYNKKDLPTEKVHAYGKTWGVWLNKGEKVYD